MRIFRRILIGACGAGLVVLSLGAAPASASGVSVSVNGDTYYQFLKTCDSASDCNTVSSTSLAFLFQLSRLVSFPVTVRYKVTNGTAINGEDFNTPVTGSVTIPANSSNASLLVPLVNEGEFGTSKTFTVTITGTSPKIGVTGGPATGTILGGNVATDCNFSNPQVRSMSLTCSNRPAGQVWHMNLLCAAFKVYIGIGNDVTGDGTSSATCSGGINTGEGFLVVTS